MIVMQIYPIGIVRYLEAGKNKGNMKQIQIYYKFSAGLKGVENFDSLWVLFWMHKLSEDNREVLQAHPRGDARKEKRGVFALRSPMRPNPIGLTKVKLVERKGNTLVVEGLDAFDETPVIDIKPA
jgi:tRNA-Thr(GGU) m(6)t(6)A37 methyltransferase TsaA